jgi:hypothetical protein
MMILLILGADLHLRMVKTPVLSFVGWVLSHNIFCNKTCNSVLLCSIHYFCHIVVVSISFKLTLYFYCLFCNIML